MTGQVIVALATLAAGIVGLILYVRKQQDSPESLYRRAVESYEQALKEEKEALDALQKELDKSMPNAEVVGHLSAARRAAAERVSIAKAERDRLRPRS